MSELLQQLRADQREQWRTGNRVPVETYLDRHPKLRDDREAALELIRGEMLLRVELNESIREDEYRQRFPHLAEYLRRLLNFEQLLGVGPSTNDPVTAAFADAVTPDGGQAVTASAAAENGRTLPRIPGYELLAVLGRGARGTVYQARQHSLNRLVALKLIADDAGMSRREAEIAGGLRHDNIVQVHEFGEHEGHCFLVMEYLSGGTLRHQWAGRPQSPVEAARLMETLARAVHAVHEQDVIHRDLKPANVLLDEKGTPKVADFGLAKQLNSDYTILPSAAIAGTVGYMAPEQAEGKSHQVGRAADVYALGVILYEALAGRQPFQGDLAEVLEQTRTQPPPPLRGRERQRPDAIPRDLETICLKCLEKKPEQRYASAAELADRLRLFQEGKPIPDRPPGWREKLGRRIKRHPWLVAASVLLVLVAAAVPFYRHYTDPDRPRKLAEATLAAGNPFTFAGHEPLPGPWRWVVGEAGPLQVDPVEGRFSFRTLTTSLLELVADPGSDHYRFSVEVRHEDSADASLVGIYFSHQRRITVDPLEVNSYLTLNYADRGLLAKIRNPRGGDLLSRVRVWGGFCSSDRPGPAPQEVVGKELRFVPARPLAGPAPWRKLSVEVTPFGARAHWSDGLNEPELIDDLTTNQLDTCFQKLRGRFPEMIALPDNFRSRGGLGIYLYRGAASFRRIEVMPLSVDP